MRQKRVGGPALSLFLVSLTVAGGILWTAELQAAVISQDEAHQILKALNDKEDLFPSSLMGSPGRYEGLSAANCSGLEPAPGWKIAWESAGRNTYGIEFKYAGDPSPTIQIGFLYSSAPFVIGDETMDAGAYAVLANSETFQLSGDTKTTHWVRDQEVVDMRTIQLPLANPLDAALFGRNAPAGVAFRVEQNGKEVVLRIGDNVLPLRRK